MTVDDVWWRLGEMATLQRRHNEQVHPRWAAQGHEYYRAVWVECAELLDHFGWKWWKRQDSDLDQVRLEVVDIWHFGLSELLRGEQLNRALAGRLQATLTDPDSTVPDFRLAVEELARTCLASKGFDIGAFAALMRALPMTFDELYETYVAKNVLNAFRQDHGYRTGHYIKIWDGREDNEHLTEILRGLDPRAESFATDLGAALAARYAGLVGKNADSGGRGDVTRP